MSRFEWRHDGRRILLPVLSLRPTPTNDLTSIAATALVDTGATATGIAHRLAHQLGLSGRGKRPLISAQGSGFAERYTFRIGLVQQFEDDGLMPYVFDEVLGFELTDGSGINVVLGMDILRQCDFRIMRNGSCVLATGAATLQ